MLSRLRHKRLPSDNSEAAAVSSESNVSSEASNVAVRLSLLNIFFFIVIYCDELYSRVEIASELEFLYIGCL